MPKKRQIINPYVRFGRKAQGPYAQNLGGGAFARSIAIGAEKCFRIISAEIGNPYPEAIRVCFNVDPDDATCHVVPDFFFTNVTRAEPYTLQTPITQWPSVNCLEWLVQYSAAGEDPDPNGNGPDDVIVLDYTPGTCHKEGSSEPECVLDPYVDYPVTNSIWGPISMRIGDIDDTTLVVVFPTDVATVTDGNWAVGVAPGGGIVIQSSVIVGNAIHFTLSGPVSPTDTVTISCDNQQGATATDGRYCWKFYNEPVFNALGANFWIREDLGQWRNESVGRWQLET